MKGIVSDQLEIEYHSINNQSNNSQNKMTVVWGEMIMIKTVREWFKVNWNRSIIRSKALVEQ